MKLLFLFLCIFSIHCGHSFSLDVSDNADESSPLPSGETIGNNGSLTIVSINVGQGDATLLITPSWKTILIDGGFIEEGTNAILPLFSQLGITQLDYLFSSHFDADHIGGIPEIISGQDGKTDTDDDLVPQIIYDRGGTPENQNKFYDAYIDTVGSSRQTMFPGETLDLEDGVTIKCLIINGKTAEGQSISLDADDENGASMGLLITYGSFHYFTAGDLTGGGFSGNEATENLEEMVAPLVGEVDILHINHHGSETSSSKSFLEALSPTVALISTGNYNPHGHPDSIVLNRLSEIGAEVYQTETGSGGLLPEAHILSDSIFMFVDEDGGYEVNGDEYETKRE